MDQEVEGAKVVELETAVKKRSRRRAPGAPAATCVGWFTKWDDAHGAMVDYPGNPGAPVPARSTVQLDANTVERAVRENYEVVLCFDQDRWDRPIVIGFIQPHPAEARRDSIEVTIEDEVVTLRGKERVELRCGQASIILTKEGKVLVRGTFVSAQSSGAHRLRGGTVEIN